MSHKLLLADDSVTIQRVIELTFADEDVQVLTAGDGEQAIASIQRERPDIVLADVGMPKRSGYDVSAFVKGAPEFSHIPVLLLTGAFEPVDERRAHASGCDGVLVKPFEPQHVIARVRELLDNLPPGAPVRPAGNVTRAVSDVPRPVERLAPHRAPAPKPAPAANSDDQARPLAQDMARPASDLDAYFDRLDAAFAGISPNGPAPQPPEAPPRREGPVMERDLDWFDPPSPSGLQAAPAGEAPPSPQPAPAGQAPPSPEASTKQAPPEAAPSQADAPTEPIPVTFASPPVAPQWPVPSRLAPQPPPVEPAESSGSFIADAFSALLAAEQGDADAPPLRLPATSGSPVATDEVIDDIVRRVVERMGSQAMQDRIADVVSRVAERLVREEIDRIRSKHS